MVGTNRLPRIIEEVPFFLLVHAAGTTRTIIAPRPKVNFHPVKYAQTPHPETPISEPKAPEHKVKPETNGVSWFWKP